MSLNRVILTGRVSDYGCRISWAESGKAQTTFTLLVEEVGRDDHRFKTFVPIIVMGPKAERVAEELEPGDPVMLEGRLSWKAGRTKDSGGLVVVAFDAERLVPARAVESAN